MPTVKLQDIKKLRELTGAGVMEAKKALLEAKGDQDRAKTLLSKWGMAKAAEREGKEANEGLVYSYIHAGGRVGAIVKLSCETDFVARSEEFVKLAKELSLQVASMMPKDVKELLAQAYIRDPRVKMDDLVKEVAAKVKEKVAVEEIKWMKVS